MNTKPYRYVGRALAALLVLAMFSCGKDPKQENPPTPQKQESPQKDDPDQPQPDPVNPDPQQPPVPPPPTHPVPPREEPKPTPPAPRPQPPQPAPQPQPQPQPQPVPPPSPEPPNLTLGPPAWGAARVEWSNAVLSVVNQRRVELERARDRDIFCPGYDKASPRQRANCWLLIVAAISKFESSFKPDTTFREPNGELSVGLLALSAGQCPNAPTVLDLKHPVKNLICGVNKLAQLVGRDRMIDGSQIGPDGKVRPPLNKLGKVPYPGATAYWSTLKPRHFRWDPTRQRTLKLGYKAEIIPLTRGYKGR